MRYIYIFFLIELFIFFYSDAGYRMMSGGGGGGGDKNDLKKNENYKRAVADYQAANTQGTDVKK